ncbi:lysophospholipase L1-like esterase [Murinocardiopsis flavida]|uniref:Lysophospholipase L1-like esterase n=1 Tax=Murinocardiopsis flavida TaxID=645275 RepID=A0A2P8DEF0_9ACTN|nr:SGNH/GDSL hydrolase family protein [Murinocardiopsis flavida]PSK95582.1 lysophospholipase L1-like esterase [Murinocardiopsis flavida]
MGEAGGTRDASAGRPARTEQVGAGRMRRMLLAAAQVLVWAAVPVLVVQGRGVRRTTPRLPEARGPAGASPTAGEPVGPPLRLLVVGDSTAAGVGVESHGDGIAGRLGAELAARTGREVRWRVDGRSGRTARDVLAALAPGGGDRPDVVLVLVGVNDVLRMTSVRAYARSVGAIIAALRERHGAGPALVLGAVPEMGGFPALPWPLRPLLGLRARALDAAAMRVSAAEPGVAHVPMPRADGAAAEFYAADRFHPGAAGYALWAAGLAPVCLAGRAEAR